MSRVGRRSILGLGAAVAFGAVSSETEARGRLRFGGRLRFSVPWSLERVDPHELSDPAAALFGPALFESLYTIDDRGQFESVLAEGLPVVDGGGCVVRLRGGLRTSRGVPLDARDVVFSLERSGKRAGLPLVAALGKFAVHPNEPLNIAFPKVDRGLVLRALASSVTAIVPRSFSPQKPDGTGAFDATVGGGRLLLTRNVRAAAGASFLDAIEVGQSSGISDSLRAFESEREDIGWLGGGFHTTRKGSKPFEFVRAMLVVLRAGKGLGELAKPGALQALCDGIPQGKLAHLGLGALPNGQSNARFPGQPVDLVYDRASAHLAEIADALVDALSTTGHELTLRGVSASELLQRKKSDDAHLALSVVRPYGATVADAHLAMAAFDDLASAKDAARATAVDLRAAGRTLRTAVLGEVRPTGAAIPGLSFAKGRRGVWDLGSSRLEKR